MILLVAKNEFKRSLKNKKKLILTNLLPLITIIVALGVNTLMKPSINIGVIENEYSNKKVEEKINDIDKVNIIKADKESMNTDMILAKYLAVVEFKENNTIKVYSLDKKVKSYIELCMMEIIHSGSTNAIEELVTYLLKDGLTPVQRGNGFMLVTLIITCTISAVVMIKDKEEGVLRRYSVTPNKISSYILGNFVYNILNTGIQVILSILILYILKIDVGISLDKFIILGLIISIVATTIATLITVMSKSELQASLLSSVIALLMGLFGGAFLPIDKMPDALQSISNVSITKWIIELTSLLESGIFSKNSITLIGVIILLSIVTVVVSTRIGKKKFL